MPDGKSPSLTPKQEAFVREYLVDLNAAAAARRAGYSEKTARKIGCENLTKPDIQEAIRKAAQARADRVELTADMVVRELMKVGFANMADFAHWNENGVSLEESTDLSADQTAAVAEVGETVTQFGGSKRLKLHSKEKALELLGRHLGIFNDKLDLNTSTPGPPTVNLVIEKEAS